MSDPLQQVIFVSNMRTRLKSKWGAVVRCSYCKSAKWKRCTRNIELLRWCLIEEDRVQSTEYSVVVSNRPYISQSSIPFTGNILVASGHSLLSWRNTSTNRRLFDSVKTHKLSRRSRSRSLWLTDLTPRPGKICKKRDYERITRARHSTLIQYKFSVPNNIYLCSNGC